MSCGVGGVVWLISCSILLLDSSYSIINTLEKSVSLRFGTTLLQYYTFDLLYYVIFFYLKGRKNHPLFQISSLQML